MSVKTFYQKKYLLGRLDILMGGRSAEKLIFNDISTGAGNDIEVATDTARRMVCEWGMSKRIGPLTFGKKSEEIFLGREISHSRDYSDQISTAIDDNIIRLVKNAEKNASNILSEEKEVVVVGNGVLYYCKKEGELLSGLRFFRTSFTLARPGFPRRSWTQVTSQLGHDNQIPCLPTYNTN